MELIYYSFHKTALDIMMKLTLFCINQAFIGEFRALPRQFGKMMSEKNWNKCNCTVSSLVGSRGKAPGVV